MLLKEKSHLRYALVLVISLLAAGLLVSIGGILALAFHPYFAAVPALVGAGLVFAGITDTCAMGMMLAKMPWNRAT